MIRIQNGRSSVRRPRKQEGYVLLTLLLVMALLVIGAAAVAPTIAFQIRRDREEEMVHRGVQYTRAFRSFIKKTGRYPRRFEELRDTNGLRFIRKIYKDPITGKDFKPLHMNDIPVPGQAPNLNPSDPQAGVNDTGSDANSDPANAAAPAPSSNRGYAASGNSVVTGSSVTGPGSTGSTSTNSTFVNEQPGLLIMGVVSTSKAKSIREFSHKNHYNEWLFFYDPRYDNGAEIKGPTSLTLSGTTLPPPLPGQNQIPGSQGNGSQGPETQFPGTSSSPSSPQQ